MLGFSSGKDSVALVGGPLAGRTADVDLDKATDGVALETEEGHAWYRRTGIVREIDGKQLVEFEWVADE